MLVAVGLGSSECECQNGRRADRGDTQQLRWNDRARSCESPMVPGMTHAGDVGIILADRYVREVVADGMDLDQRDRHTRAAKPPAAGPSRGYRVHVVPLVRAPRDGRQAHLRVRSPPWRRIGQLERTHAPNALDHDRIDLVPVRPDRRPALQRASTMGGRQLRQTGPAEPV